MPDVEPVGEVAQPRQRLQAQEAARQGVPVEGHREHVDDRGRTRQEESAVVDPLGTARDEHRQQQDQTEQDQPPGAGPHRDGAVTTATAGVEPQARHTAQDDRLGAGEGVEVDRGGVGAGHHAHGHVDGGRESQQREDRHQAAHRAPPTPQPQPERDRPDQVELLLDGQRPRVQQRGGDRLAGEVGRELVDEVPVGDEAEGRPHVQAQRELLRGVGEEIGIDPDERDGGQQGR